MKNIIFALSLLGVCGSPLISSAATYNYLDLTGTVRSVDAPSATEALAYVNSLDTTLHTGVALDLGILNQGENFGQDYTYRTVNGTTVFLRAATYDAAWILATDRDPSSGIMLLK